jgi:hypothetical protein
MFYDYWNILHRKLTLDIHRKEREMQVDREKQGGKTTD